MYCGELDEYKLLSQNQLFSDSLNHYGIEHTSNIDPYGDHITSLITSLPEGLNFLYEAMTKNDPNSVDAIPGRQLSVYPNPVTDYFVIENGSSDVAESAVIFSLNGIAHKYFSHQQLLSGKFFAGDLPPGCYILQIELSNKLKKRLKIIKQ